MKKNLPIEFHYNSQNVRTLKIENQPWFVGKDVCDVLEYSNSRETLKVLDDDERGESEILTPYGTQTMTVINQSGLYHLILKSHKPEAKKFRKWVTSEVIPSLMRNGTYTTRGRYAALGNIETWDQMYECFKVYCWRYSNGKRYQLYFNQRETTIQDLNNAQEILTSLINQFK